MGRRTARAVAHANIALVKYWGKRDAALNLPAAGSLSLTLEALRTETVVVEADEDALCLDGQAADARRLIRWLDDARPDRPRLAVTTTNHFPTASGLASSASGYAALAAAVSSVLDLPQSPTALSILARRGSGSAARSIFGGFVEMHRGQRDDGSDCFAEPIDETPAWAVRLVVCVVGGGVKKKLSSRDAMDRCAATSPLYRGWLDSVPPDLRAARAAIGARDLVALGDVAERSALTMHAAAMASRPGIFYFCAGTVAAMERVRALRAEGISAFFTMDAGPHVKVLCLEEELSAVTSAMEQVPGVDRVFSSAPGPGVVVD